VIEQEKLTITEEKTKKAEELIKVDTPKRFKEYDERLKEIVKKNDEWKTRLEAHIVKLKGLLKAKNEVCALFLCTWSSPNPRRTVCVPFIVCTLGTLNGHQMSAVCTCASLQEFQALKEAQQKKEDADKKVRVSFFSIYFCAPPAWAGLTCSNATAAHGLLCRGRHCFTLCICPQCRLLPTRAFCRNVRSRERKSRTAPTTCGRRPARFVSK